MIATKPKIPEERKCDSENCKKMLSRKNPFSKCNSCMNDLENQLKRDTEKIKK